jgi:hypothetical protein
MEKFNAWFSGIDWFHENAARESFERAFKVLICYMPAIKALDVIDSIRSATANEYGD